MYGYKEASLLVRRELTLQGELARCNSDQVLNVPLLMGVVGAGKTSIARNEALEMSLPLCAINCGENSDATDVSGVPLPAMVRDLLERSTDPTVSDNERKRSKQLYMEWVLNKYAAQACNEPVLLFFDDLDKAPPPVQSAMLAITGNRMFRDKEIHPGTLIMGAGNRIDDDEYANQISESMRTRMTIIEMEPDLVSFTEYGGKPSGLTYELSMKAQQIHPVVLGYLQYRPDHLHQWKEGVNRFPTPRGWWEASRQFYYFDDPKKDIFRNGRKDNWKGIVARKCGDHVGNDFWSWFEIISKINVEEILTTGDVKTSSTDTRMASYAAIFAVSQALSKKVSKKYVGLEKFISDLLPELRVAFVVQLSPGTRSKISSLFEGVADVMMSDIVKGADGDAVLRPKPDTKS